jgi:DNA (cytosine-5)-methyltransferase 1
MVDLHAGCGGLTLGMAQSVVAAGGSLDVRLAVDFESDAVEVYRANFPFANAHTASVESFFDGGLGARATAAEQLTASEVGEVDLLVGGPPCQGYSDLNNRTRPGEGGTGAVAVNPS